MNEPPMAGTFRLDGMLQGPLPPDTETSGALQSWVATAKAEGLYFHLRVEGGTFSLVADPTVQKTSRLKGDDLETRLRDALQSLLDLLPPRIRESSFSTIRSEEFRKDAAVRTLYSVESDGRIGAEQRIADIRTREAAPEITPASLRRAVLPALVAMLLVLFISTFFIDYRKLFTEVRDRVTPLKKEELIVRQELANEYINFELAEVDRKHDSLIFRLARGSAWESAMGSKPGDAMDWTEFTTILAIHQGRFRIELFNKEHKLLASREVDVRGLRKKESIEIAVVANPGDRIATAVLRP